MKGATLTLGAGVALPGFPCEGVVSK